MILGMLFFLMADASGDEARATEIRIRFMFKNEVIHETIKVGSLKTLDDMMESLWGGRGDQYGTEIEVPMLEPASIRDKKAFARFKTLWREEGSGGEEDINADEFVQFFRAADYWELYGGALQRFAENMLKRGLLGKHSSGIIGTSPYGRFYRKEISWRMLVAFATQVGLRVRVRDEEMRFYPADDWKAEDYGKAAAEFEERPPIKKVSLRCMIPADTDGNTSCHAAIFGWLLCHAGVSSSLHVGHKLKIESGTIELLNSELSIIADEYGSMKMNIEGLDLDLSKFPSKLKSFAGLMAKYPHLKELNLRLSRRLPDNITGCFSKCKKLEKLKIWGHSQNSSFAKNLLVDLPWIKELDIQVKTLEKCVASSFSKCKNLERLKIWRECCQPSSFVMLKSWWRICHGSET